MNLIIFSALENQCQTAILNQTLTSDPVLLPIVMLVKRTFYTCLINTCRQNGSPPLSNTAILCPPFQDRVIVALDGSTVFDDVICQLGNIVVKHFNAQLFQQHIHLVFR